MKTIKHTLTENSIVLIISTAIVKIIGAVFKIPLATDTFLGDLGFGYFSVAHDIFMPFYVLAISGLPSAVSQITAKYVAKRNYYSVKENFKITRKLFVVLGLIFSLLVAILSVPLLFSSTEKNTVFSILSIIPAIFLCFIISVYRGFFEGFNNMYPTAVSKIIEAVFKLVLGLVLSYMVMSITHNPALAAASAMLAISFGTLLSLFYLTLKLKRNNPLNNREILDLKENENITVKNIIILAVPYILASLSASVVALVDVLTVKTYISNATASYLEVASQNLNLNFNDISTYLYGLRSKAFTIYYLIPTVTMSIGVGALPILTEHRTKNDDFSLKNSTNFSLKLICTFTFPAAFGLIALSGPIMNLLYSSTDHLSGNLLLLYGIAAIFAGLAIPITTIIQALNLQRFAVRSIIIALIIKIVTNIIFVTVPNINIYAAPLGTVFCYLFMSVDLIIVLQRKIGNIDYKNVIIKPLTSALICGVCAFGISSISSQKTVTIIAILTAVLIYFLFLFLLKTFSKNELSEIPFVKKFIKK